MKEKMNILILIEILLIFNFDIKAAAVKNNFNDNILEEIEFDFRVKTFEFKSKLGGTKTKFKNYLQINKNELEQLKKLKLSEFLAEKLLQFKDKLDLIQITGADNEIKVVIENEKEILATKRHDCKLKRTVASLASSKEEQSQVCPFDWHVDKRENKYPFQRAFASCKCSDCQAIVSKLMVSACRPDYMLFPILFRESFDASGQIENWRFYLEKVAVSCSCTSLTGL